MAPSWSPDIVKVLKSGKNSKSRNLIRPNQIIEEITKFGSYLKDNKYQTRVNLEIKVQQTASSSNGH
jgi:hypothetical protein